MELSTEDASLIVDQEGDETLALAYLQSVPDPMSISLNTAMAGLREKYNRDFNKTIVHAAIQSFLVKHIASIPEDSVEQEGSDEETAEEQEDDTEEVMQDFPDGWQDRLDEVVWVQTNKKWPWYDNMSHFILHLMSCS